MRRREFISVFGSTVFAWPLAARAQQSSHKIPVVGVLWHAGSAEEERVPLGALVQGFRNLGYVEDRETLFLSIAFPTNSPSCFDTLAAELAKIIRGAEAMFAVRHRQSQACCLGGSPSR